MKRVKRAIDVIAALVIISVFWPFFLILWFVIKINLGTPVLFCQERPGYKGIPFKMYKFRTMTNECDAKGHLLPDEKRLKAVGKFLRSTSLDELPELYNVLRGEMSLVGPRPLLIEYLPLYTKEQMRRHDVLPGITGWAQINGRNAVSWEDRFQMDQWYVDNQSFGLDFKIIAMTIGTVFKREGVQQEGHVTMSQFTGTKKLKTEKGEE